MKHPHLKLLLLSAFLLLAGQGRLASADEQVSHNLSEARKLAREFNARLRAKLHLAIAADGPLGPTKTCATHTPGNSREAPGAAYYGQKDQQAPEKLGEYA